MKTFNSKNHYLLGFTLAILIGSTLVYADKPEQGNHAISFIEQFIIPDNFTVYYRKDVGAVNHPFKGAEEKILPTINQFRDIPGCYVACYRHDNGVYPVADNIYAIGQIRVPGRYINKICQPKNFENKDISAEKEFKQQCEKHFPKSCGHLKCWVGGATAWYGG